MPIKYNRLQLIILIAHASALGLHDDAERFQKQFVELNNKEINNA